MALLYWKLGSDVISGFPIQQKLLGYFKRPLRWIYLSPGGDGQAALGTTAALRGHSSRTWHWLHVPGRCCSVTGGCPQFAPLCPLCVTNRGWAVATAFALML